MDSHIHPHISRTFARVRDGYNTVRWVKSAMAPFTSPVTNEMSDTTSSPFAGAAWQVHCQLRFAPSTRPHRARHMPPRKAAACTRRGGDTPRAVSVCSCERLNVRGEVSRHGSDGLPEWNCNHRTYWS
eukprot:3614852-Prymnesium_polylepis.1